MEPLKPHNKNFMTAVSLLLCVLFVLSSVMTSLAWSDFTQTKTNIFRGTADNVTVVLHLIEKDADGVISANPVKPIMNAEFQLYRIEADGTEALIPGGPWVTDINGQIVFDGRDEQHPRLEPGSYVFVETKPAFGYTYDRDENDNSITRYEFEVAQADALSGNAITVSAYNRRGSGTLAVKKTVKGNAPADAEFAFTVTFSDNGEYSYRVDGGERLSIVSGGTLTLRHGQTALFENIPIGVQYHVAEAAHPDYVISSSGHQGSITEAGSVAAFVNTYTTEPPDEEEQVKLTVTKKLAGQYPGADADKEFSFTLIVDGEKISFTLKPDAVKEFVLPQGAQYEVIEEDYFADGYDTAITNGFGTAAGKEIQVVVTNSFIGDPVVDIEGEKTWVLGDNTDVTLPEHITVRLKNGDTVVLEKAVKPDANGDWKYSFTAPKYDAEGKRIKYTVEELAVPCFIPSYKGYDITNTYVQPVAADPPVITKVVEGENAPDTRFAFVMKGQDGAPMPEGAVGNSKTIYITGSGEVEFGSMEFTGVGVYTYDICETDTGEAGWTYDTVKYTLTFTVTEEDGRLVISEQRIERNGEAAEELRFTNSYTEPPAKTVTVQGRKIWNHGANPVDRQPKSILLYVYADGELVVQWQLSEQDDWSYSFELPKFAEGDREIVYTVDEAAVANYEKTIDGFNIINTYTEATDDPFIPSDPGVSPPTGDYTRLTFWFALMLFSLLGLIVTLLIGRRSRIYAGKHSTRFGRGK